MKKKSKSTFKILSTLCFITKRQSTTVKYYNKNCENNNVMSVY